MGSTYIRIQLYQNIPTYTHKSGHLVTRRCLQAGVNLKSRTAAFSEYFENFVDSFIRVVNLYCEAQARVRQGSARDGPQGDRPQSLNPCLELTLKLVGNYGSP